MRVLKAFRFRLRPTEAQEQEIRQACGAARYAWNWTLGTCKREYEAALEKAKADDDFTMVPDRDPRGRARKEEDGTPKLRKKWNAKTKSMSRARLYKAFVDEHQVSAAVKRKPSPNHPFPWLCTTHCHVYSYPVENVVKAYVSWWRESAKGRRFGPPRFKSKGSARDSFTIQLQGEPKGPRERQTQMRALRVRAKEVAASRREDGLDADARERLKEQKRAADKEIEDLREAIRRESDQAVLNERFFQRRLLKVPGIGWLKCRRDPQVRIGDAIPTRVTITRVADRWYASVGCVCTIPDPFPAAQKPVLGVDLGVNALVTLSDGTQIAPPQYLERNLRRLARLQRQLQRKEKGSNRRYKAKMRVARLHANIADARTDFLHKLSRRLVDGASVVVVEGFDIQKLLGNVDRRKRRRQISDAAWGELRRQLGYKGQWYGTETLVRGEYDLTDQPCHVCGTINQMPDDTSDYDCSACGLHTTRQENTALLLMSFGEGNLPEGTPGHGGTHARGLDGSASSPSDDGNQLGRNANGSQPAPGGGDSAGLAGFLSDENAAE